VRTAAAVDGEEAGIIKDGGFGEIRPLTQIGQPNTQFVKGNTREVWLEFKAQWDFFGFLFRLDDLLGNRFAIQEHLSPDAFARKTGDVDVRGNRDRCVLERGLAGAGVVNRDV
jgi:hypothetical protein